jgi:shikimate 5-dehydrogenase
MSERSILVGLIGRNVLKSLSPALYEDGFAAAKLRGYYHLMDLDVLTGRRLPDLIAAVRAAGFAEEAGLLGQRLSVPFAQNLCVRCWACAASLGSGARGRSYLNAKSGARLSGAGGTEGL